jgi:hypothetical protein
MIDNKAKPRSTKGKDREDAAPANAPPRDTREFPTANPDSGANKATVTPKREENKATG